MDKARKKPTRPSCETCGWLIKKGSVDGSKPQEDNCFKLAATLSVVALSHGYIGADDIMECHPPKGFLCMFYHRNVRSRYRKMSPMQMVTEQGMRKLNLK